MVDSWARNIQNCISRKMQMKIINICTVHLLERLKIKMPLASSVGEDVEQSEFTDISVGSVKMVLPCISPWSCCNKEPQIVWLEQLIFSQFWRSEVQGQGVGRLVSSGVSVLGLQMAPPPGSSLGLPSGCLCPYLLFHKDISHIGLQSCLVTSLSFNYPF